MGSQGTSGDSCHECACEGEQALSTGFLPSPGHREGSLPPTHPAIVGQQDGVTLDVTVDDALGVEHSQRLEHSQAHGSNLLLVHPVWAGGASAHSGTCLVRPTLG